MLTDVIGIVKSIEDVRPITTKAGKDLKKRDIFLVDESQVQIRMTLWGNDVSLSSIVQIRLTLWGKTEHFGSWASNKLGD